MLYTNNMAIGHAGEFLFAYHIAHILRWPCRLLDVDIGIDAQVEILEPSGKSTGRFVGFQVKATAKTVDLSKPDTLAVKVDKRHIDYWQKQGTPVFVVLVTLIDQCMYLHCIDKERPYPAIPGGSVLVKFNSKKDKFGPKSRKKIADGVDALISRELSDDLKAIKSAATTLSSAAASDDLSVVTDAIETLGNAERALARAQRVVNIYSLSTRKISTLTSQLDQAKKEFRAFLKSSRCPSGSPLEEELVSHFLAQHL